MWPPLQAPRAVNSTAEGRLVTNKRREDEKLGRGGGGGGGGKEGSCHEVTKVNF